MGKKNKNRTIINVLSNDDTEITNDTDTINETDTINDTEITNMKLQIKNLKNSLYNKANNHVRNKKYDLAIEYYIQSIKIENNSNAAYNLALLYEELLQVDNAEKYYKIASDMGNHDALYNYALLLMENKKYKESIEYFKKVIRNGEFDIIETYIECLCLIDERDNAYELLEKYKKYINSDDEIKKLFAISVRLPYD